MIHVALKLLGSLLDHASRCELRLVARAFRSVPVLDRVRHTIGRDGSPVTEQRLRAVIALMPSLRELTICGMGWRPDLTPSALALLEHVPTINLVLRHFEFDEFDSQWLALPWPQPLGSVSLQLAWDFEGDAAELRAAVERHRPRRVNVAGRVQDVQLFFDGFSSDGVHARALMFLTAGDAGEPLAIPNAAELWVELDFGEEEPGESALPLLSLGANVDYILINDISVQEWHLVSDGVDGAALRAAMPRLRAIHVTFDDTFGGMHLVLALAAKAGVEVFVHNAARLSRSQRIAIADHPATARIAYSEFKDYVVARMCSARMGVHIVPVTAAICPPGWEHWIVDERAAADWDNLPMASIEQEFVDRQFSRLR